jgi:signal transduction histidine kinase
MVVFSSDLREQLRKVKMIQASSKMLLMLNHAIINQQMIKRETFVPNLTPTFDVSALFRNFADVFQYHLGMRNLKLNLDPIIEGDPEAIEAMTREGLLIDKDLYEQTLFNVYMNAYKFSKQFQVIDVKLSLKFRRLSKKCEVEFTT